MTPVGQRESQGGRRITPRERVGHHLWERAQARWHGFWNVFVTNHCLVDIKGVSPDEPETRSSC